jgi:hypothetical protein
MTRVQQLEFGVNLLGSLAVMRAQELCRRNFSTAQCRCFKDSLETEGRFYIRLLCLFFPNRLLVFRFRIVIYHHAFPPPEGMRLGADLARSAGKRPPLGPLGSL